MNAKKRNVFTFTQSGTGQLTTDQVWALFDGGMAPQYSSTGIDPADPYVLTLELSKYTSHTQAFVAFGWTCRYWWPTKFKVEAYNVYSSANTWVTLCDYSTTAVQLPTLIIPFGSGRVNPHTGTTISGSFTKFRITIYQGDTSQSNMWGISEIFYCHPEAYTCFYGLNTFSSDVAKAYDTSFTGTDSIKSAFDNKVDYTLLNNSSVIGNGAPAADCKAYWASTSMPNDRVKILYNVPGNEATIFFSRRSNYGSILKYGYTDKYIYILRYNNAAWKSDDWEKISAGYADSAGSATRATQDSDGNAINATYFKSSGNITLVAGTATKIGTQNGADVKLTITAMTDQEVTDLLGAMSA
jgi:hypothetical protein